MRKLPQSVAYTLTMKLFTSSDHVTAATGKTVAIKISKAGGAFADPAAGATNATEISNGWYKVALGTGDTDTLGDLIVRGTAATCDDVEQIAQVVSATTGGASNLDAAVSSRSSHAAADVWAVATRVLTAGTNIALAKGTGVTGFNDLDAAGVRGAVGLASANLDTQLGGIDSKTTNLPSDPADESLIITATDAIMSRLGAPAGASVSADVAAIKAETGAIKSKTDGFTFTISGQVDTNIKSVNDVLIHGTGAPGNEWGP